MVKFSLAVGYIFCPILILDMYTMGSYQEQHLRLMIGYNLQHDYMLDIFAFSIMLLIDCIILGSCKKKSTFLRYFSLLRVSGMVLYIARLLTVLSFSFKLYMYTMPTISIMISIHVLYNLVFPLVFIKDIAEQ